MASTSAPMTLTPEAMADILRQGKRMRPGNAAVARECLLERQHPADADVLVRLRNRNR